VRINSAHRDWLHNIAIGGAPRSAHLYIAFDVPFDDPGELYEAAKKAGFQSFGFYETFLHMDMRPDRMWFGSEKAKEIWAGVDI
jgi:zinc D-Ala-D-Ala carboxypeptidase